MFKECVLFEQIPPGASAHSQAGVNIANNDEISATYTFRPSLRDWDGETLPGLGWGRGRPSRQIEAPAWTPAGVFWGQNSHCGLGRRWDGADGRGGIRILALDQGMKKTTMKPAWGRKIYFPKQFHLNDASDIHKFKEKAFLSETVLFLLLSAKAGTEEHIAKQVEKFINIKACYAFILPRWKGIFFKKSSIFITNMLCECTGENSGWPLSSAAKQPCKTSERSWAAPHGVWLSGGTWRECVCSGSAFLSLACACSHGTAQVTDDTWRGFRGCVRLFVGSGDVNLKWDKTYKCGCWRVGFFRGYFSPHVADLARLSQRRGGLSAQCQGNLSVGRAWVISFLNPSSLSISSITKNCLRLETRRSISKIYGCHVNVCLLKDCEKY